ncbi:MAG: glycosyl transferase group 1, partial [Hyphomicrobiales bacterium]|nr:glycosyl transferase group 1 [Hyphomicrobiales bacterium]
ARFRSAGGRTLRIYNPVSAGNVPEKMDLAVLMAREPMVLAVGRLVPAKGFLNLLRAFARLEEPNARLVILGSGPQREELLAEISRLGLEQRVNLPGHMNEPWSFFKQARCLVSASHMESFGLVLVEAMAHGLPVVSTDCGATAEVLESGRFGSLVPVGDEARLTAAIQKALSDPGDPAPRRAHATTFSTAAALDEYQRLIDRITEGTSPLPA